MFLNFWPVFWPIREHPDHNGKSGVGGWGGWGVSDKDSHFFNLSDFEACEFPECIVIRYLCQRSEKSSSVVALDNRGFPSSEMGVAQFWCTFRLFPEIMNIEVSRCSERLRRRLPTAMCLRKIYFGALRCYYNL